MSQYDNKKQKPLAGYGQAFRSGMTMKQKWATDRLMEQDKKAFNTKPNGMGRNGGMSQYEELKVMLRGFAEQDKGFIEVAESVNTQAIEAIKSLEHQLATVTVQRDLLGKILSCQVKLNESEACFVYQDCYEALASLKGE